MSPPSLDLLRSVWPNRPFLMIYGGTIKKGFSTLLNKNINVGTVGSSPIIDRHVVEIRSVLRSRRSVYIRPTTGRRESRRGRANSK